MKNAYDHIATQFNGRAFREQKYIDILLSNLTADSRVLDVGCGTGKPVAQYLIEQGCSVTGIDASEGMLAIARRQAPKAQFLHCDMLSYEPAEHFSAIVAWDSVFHIPRTEHAQLFQKFYNWLISEGVLLVSLGGSSWEGTSEMFGYEFFYSGFAPDESVKILKNCGFEILLSEVDDPSSRGHMAVLTRKPN